MFEITVEFTILKVGPFGEMVFINYHKTRTAQSQQDAQARIETKYKRICKNDPLTSFRIVLIKPI